MQTSTPSSEIKHCEIAILVRLFSFVLFFVYSVIAVLFPLVNLHLHLAYKKNMEHNVKINRI